MTVLFIASFNLNIQIHNWTRRLNYKLQNLFAVILYYQTLNYTKSRKKNLKKPRNYNIFSKYNYIPQANTQH